MQCALASHKLYKKQGWKDDFLFFLQDVCTLLLQNAPRLERNPSRVAIDNIARLTGRNHWPVKRVTPEEWKAMKSKTKKCRVCLAKGRLTRSWKHIKTTWVCKDVQGNHNSGWKKNALNSTIPSLTLVSNTKLVHNILVCLEEIYIDFRHWKSERKNIRNNTSKYLENHQYALVGLLQ